MIDIAAPADAPTPPARPQPIQTLVLSVAAVVAAGFALRLFLGLLEPVDPDEAVEGVTALHILHGQFPLMESNAHYLGALESYFLVPFVGLLGPTLLALRVATGVLGAGYVLTTYFLGRELFRRHHHALLLAGVAAVFPFFAITFAEKARNYAGLLLFEALCLALIIRVAWPRGVVRRRDWLLLGLAAGLGMWNHPLLAVALLPGIAAIAARGPALGWRPTLQGALWALAAALVGFAPAIVYNLETHLGSLRHLYGPFTAYSIPPGTAVREVVGGAIPIFVGTREVWCGPAVVPPVLPDLAVIAVFGAALWLRWNRILPILRGDLTRLEPTEMVLAIAPVALIAVTVKWFNALSCEPRYMLPFAVPLVVAVAVVVLAVLRAHPPPSPSPASGRATAKRPPSPSATGGGIRRALVAAVAAGILAINGLTATRDRADGAWQFDRTVNLDAAMPALEARHPQAIWATFWLARSVQYLDGDRMPVGDYGGYVGFPDSQATARAATHPSWLFAASDPEILAFEATCAQRGIQYERAVLPGGLILYANLSQAVVPEDLDLPTQSTAQAR